MFLYPQERKESVDLEEATISSTGLQVTDKEAKLIGKNILYRTMIRKYLLGIY